MASNRWNRDFEKPLMSSTTASRHFKRLESEQETTVLDIVIWGCLLGLVLFVVYLLAGGING